MVDLVRKHHLLECKFPCQWYNFQQYSCKANMRIEAGLLASVSGYTIRTDVNINGTGVSTLLGTSFDEARVTKKFRFL